MTNDDLWHQGNISAIQGQKEEGCFYFLWLLSPYKSRALKTSQAVCSVHEVKAKRMNYCDKPVLCLYITYMYINIISLLFSPHKERKKISEKCKGNQTGNTPFYFFMCMTVKAANSSETTSKLHIDTTDTVVVYICLKSKSVIAAKSSATLKVS